MSAFNNSATTEEIKTNKCFWLNILLILGLGIAVSIAMVALFLIGRQTSQLNQLQNSYVTLNEKLISFEESVKAERESLSETNQEFLNSVSELNAELVSTKESLETSVQSLATLQHAISTGDKATQKQIFGGVGIKYKFNRDGHLIIQEVLKNSPAYNQLYIDDAITKIDDRSVKGLTAAEVTDLIRGDAGDKVTIEFIPAGQLDSSSKVTLVRALINAAQKSEKSK